MAEYKRIPTSAEVWAVIMAKHRADLHVFSSFSNPDGTFCGGSGQQGRMDTAYGFKGSDYPLMEASTTWDIIRTQGGEKRENEQHQYWLCLPQKDDDD